MASISLKMPDSLATEITAAARYRGVSKSALIREAIQMYLRRENELRPRSALSLVADLVGTCDGPEDLSTNKRYMEGFGE